jgi:hypothetical protein
MAESLNNSSGISLGESLLCHRAGSGYDTPGDGGKGDAGRCVTLCFEYRLIERVRVL